MSEDQLMFDVRVRIADTEELHEENVNRVAKRSVNA
jgi:hypothetical protein